MRKSYLKGTASFMIALILSLPIYSSIVLAAITDGSIYGETDKVRGYYRRSENIYLNVTAWISGDSEITPSQVHLNDFNGPIFHSCSGIGNGFFHCIYPMHTNSITENPFQQKVALYTDPTPAYPKGVFNSLFVLHGAFDEIAPKINSFNIVPSRIGSGNLNFQYNIYDHSYSETDTNRCAGVDKIELSYKGTLFHTALINSPSDQCSNSGTITVPVSKISNLEEGTADILLTAFDKFNLQSSTAAQFIYDKQAAFVDPDSLEIKDNYGNSIDAVGIETINGIISFTILSDDLDVTNVYGDISEINIDNIPSYNSKQAICTKFEEGYKCSFTNIKVKLDQSIIVDITINTKDLAGNEQSIILTKNIVYDNVGPSVKSITTDKVANNIKYAGAITTFIVELNEDGSGINKDNIRLDLSDIKTGLSNRAADECTNSGNDWTCYWNEISSDKSDGEKTITVKGNDKLGNPVTGTLSTTVVLDKTKPIVISSELTPIGVGIEAFKDHIKTGDTLDVTLNIREKNELTAYADFSSFVTTQDNAAGSCVREDSENWKCNWRSSSIDVPGYIIGDINFNIKDIADNNVEYKKAIEVLYYEDAVNISYWTSTIKCSSSLVDRQITNLVNARVYCSIALKPTTPDQETLSINLDYCTANDGSMGYIENIGLLNAETGSIEPYLSIDLIKGEMTTDKLSITCPLRIISRVGTKINKNPEIELINIEISFYNMPLGEYGKGIENKIQDAKDDATGGVWKIIGTLKKIWSYANLVCNTLQMLYKIKLLWGVITGKLTTAHLAMAGTPVEPVLGAAKSGACISDKTMEEISKQSYIVWDGPCKLINCQMSPEPGSISKSKGIFGDIKNSLKSWNYKGNEFLAKAPGGVAAKIFSFGQAGGGEGTIEDYFGKQPYQYMNTRDNLLVALVTGCIPGIINGLNKYRQILCLYADCLQQNAYNDVPVKVCEDQKSYATCKYILGEIFAVLPWTALFDYYIGLVKRALSDPITAIVTVFNVLGNVCVPRCDPSADASAYWIENEAICRGLQFVALLGEVINDVQGIIDDYEQIKGDYCERID